MIFFQQFHFDLRQSIQNVLFDLTLHELSLYLELSKDLLLYRLALNVLLVLASLQRIVNDVSGVLVS